MSQEPSDRLLSRLMTLHPKVIDLSLGRVERILAKLGNPERQLPPSVLIAGTNGKGSTQAMIRAGLEAEGLKVHTYTSPHLARFHERITIAGETIPEEYLAEILAECEAANAGEPITYFEITTAAAFLAYSRVPADFAVIEVGLGGRLDATNVISPDVCVITPVSRDHEQYLGNTIAAIAGEKAGILRAGVPAAIAPQLPEAEEVILATAERLGTPLSLGNRDWQVWEEHGRMAYQDGDGLLDLPLPRLIGAHQVVNAGAAITALKLLGRGDPEAAVTNAVWPARLQHLKRGPLVELAGSAELWLDGGHNPSAGEALSEAVTRLSPGPLHLVCGMLSTKDVEGYLRPMARVAESLHAVSIPGESATLPATATAAAAARAGFERVAISDTVAEAIRAITATDPGARILICGSLYLAGGVLRENG